MDFELPKNYWIERDPKGKKLDPEKLKENIDNFLNCHNVMALATACGDIVRNTPVEYRYKDGALYFLSEGGQKFNGLEVNKNVCCAIFDQMSKGICRGLQVTGIAEIIEPENPEYMDFFKFRKISPKYFEKRVPYPIPLIRINIKSFDHFDWAYARSKHHLRQHLDV